MTNRKTWARLGAILAMTVLLAGCADDPEEKVPSASSESDAGNSLSPTEDKQAIPKSKENPDEDALDVPGPDIDYDDS